MDWRQMVRIVDGLADTAVQVAQSGGVQNQKTQNTILETAMIWKLIEKIVIAHPAVIEPFNPVPNSAGIAGTVATRVA